MEGGGPCATRGRTGSRRERSPRSPGWRWARRVPRPPTPASLLVIRSIDGSANNLQHPTWGQGRPGLSARRTRQLRRRQERAGAPAKPDRYVSNRVFNDVGQNLFSEHGVSQWGWLWGQFIDHDLGLRVETPGRVVAAAVQRGRSARAFTNDFGALGFTPHPGGAGTEHRRRRASSRTRSRRYMDASMVYGSDAARATWLRDGASLLLPGRLPAAGRRPGTRTRPRWTCSATRSAIPAGAVVAGDARANENIGLTAAQTIFAREHNRIVRRCRRRCAPSSEYQIARRVVGAEIQYITYHEFLPAMGVKLAPYTGYKPDGRRDAETNEFATVGFRAHSMVHGEMEPSAPEGTWSAAQLAVVRGARDRGRARRRDRDAGRARSAWRSATRTCWSRSVWARSPRASPGAPVQERRADRRLVAQRPVRGAQADDDRPERVPGAGRRPTPASPGSPTWAPTTSRAAAITGCRATTRCARHTGWRTRTCSTRAPRSIDPNKPRDHDVHGAARRRRQPDRRWAPTRRRRTRSWASARRAWRRV